MHEMSVAKRVLAQIVQLARERHATAIEFVHLRVGEFAGIEAPLLASAFYQLTAGTLAEGARMEVEVAPLTAHCQTCHESFRPEGFRFYCPVCGATGIRITGGEELTLTSIDIAIASEVPRCQ